MIIFNHIYLENSFTSLISNITDASIDKLSAIYFSRNFDQISLIPIKIIDLRFR